MQLLISPYQATVTGRAIIDHDGKVKRRLGSPTEQHNSYLFNRPLYLTVSSRTGGLFVSDCDLGIITCISADGGIVFQYSGADVRGITGIYDNNADNDIVCAYKSHK